MTKYRALGQSPAIYVVLAIALALGGCGGGSESRVGPPPLDTDGDGTPDSVDADDDNDGVADGDDPYPLDADRGPELVAVPDPALRAALEEALGKEPGETLYEHELAKLKRLVASHEGISDLEGLQFATGLEDIVLHGNEIADLRPVSLLRDLDDLYLRGNRVSDLSPLAGLTELRNLDVSSNEIVDLEPVSGLTGLRSLNLSRNDALEDVSALRGLTALTHLELWNTRVSDLEPLAGLAGLIQLHASQSRVRDLSALSGLTALESLAISRNRVEDFSPLVGLTNLRVLWAGRTGLADLALLSSLTELTALDVWGNGVVDLTPLSGLTSITNLDVGNNDLRDLSPLSSLTSLERLSLVSNRELRDLTPISGLTRLQHLSVTFCYAVEDLSPLSNLTALEWLWAAHIGISDLSPLSNLTALEWLRVGNTEISDLSPLSNLTALSILEATYNEISDLSPLSELPKLKYLELQGNRITDLSPLAANTGLGDGARVDVRRNPLAARSVESDVPTLQDRGVDLRFESYFVRSEDGPRLHNDNLFVLPVAGELDTNRYESQTELAISFFEHFDDAFDFLMFVSNVPRPGAGNVYGRYVSVASETLGMGQGVYTLGKEFGSAGRLQGLIELPVLDFSIENGPSLHELMHRWANFVVAPYPHWGLSSAYGQLGGFQADRLVDLGNGRYTAGHFGTIVNGGNGVPYSPIELYLAGFIAPEEVPDLLVAEEPEWLLDGKGGVVESFDGHPVFVASRIVRYSIADLVAEHGMRVPDHSTSQREFRAAAILLIDESHPGYQSDLDSLSGQVAWLSHPGNDEDSSFNFYEATGGRATLEMNGLSRFGKGTLVQTSSGRGGSTQSSPPLDWSPGRAMAAGAHDDAGARLRAGLPRRGDGIGLSAPWCGVAEHRHAAIPGDAVRTLPPRGTTGRSGVLPARGLDRVGQRGPVSPVRRGRLPN